MTEREPGEVTERPQAPPIPQELPIVRLRQGIVYPHIMAPLTVTHTDDGELIDAALSRDRILGVSP